MIVKIMRGNKTITETLVSNDANEAKRHMEEQFSNVLNVRVNRPITVAETANIRYPGTGEEQPVKTDYKHYHVDFNAGKEQTKADTFEVKVTGETKIDDEAERKFEATSNFIPKVTTNRDANYLNKFGLTEADFEEPKDETLSNMAGRDYDGDHPVNREAQEQSSAAKEQSIEEKYADLASEYDEDNFQKISKGKNKNLDRY